MTWDTIVFVQTTPQKAWRAGRFWWDWPHPGDPEVAPLRAVVFDLDAIADIECAGHRRAFNAAFAELGLSVEWSPARYRQLLTLSDESRRVAAELRKRGIGTECDVLAQLLVDEICARKAAITGATILDSDVTARPGMADLIAEAYGAGVGVGIVSNGSQTWVEPLVRQLVGDGVVGAVVTADDVPRADLFRAALAGLGATARGSLAFAGSQAALASATSTEMATVLVGPDGTGTLLRVADCQRAHDSWRDAHPTPTAA